MAKKEKNLQDELLHRKYKIPNPFLSWIYYIVGRTHLLGAKYHPIFDIKDSTADCKGPCFLIWNHQSRRDHTFLTTANWPRRLSIVCEYNSFFRSHLHWAFKMGRIIPKKVFCNDMAGVRAMRDIIKQGGCVAFSPEGTSSIWGDQQPIVPGTGRFLKAFNIPVYCGYMQGSYLTNNKICSDDRLGKVYYQQKLLFTKEDLQRLSPEEIENIINKEFWHDDYEWNKEHHIEYKSNGTICTNLADMLYKCTKCGHEFEMDAQGNYIKCTHCGNGATMDDYYDFHPFNKECVIPETPTKWVREERQAIIDEIRKDPNYSFSVKCKVGILPKDHWVDKSVTSEIVGEGIYTIDHKGVHFVGTKEGKEFKFDLDYKAVWTYPMTVDLTIFSLYINEDYHDFYPDKRVVGKIIMLTEEMHRLHVNKFKNFPWFDYMYENKELGIDE